MLLSDVVITSSALASTSKRLEKIAQLAHLLEQARDGEIEAAVAFLSGEIPGGRLGIGYATVSMASSVVHAEQPSLTLLETAERLQSLRQFSGAGSETTRRQQLSMLLGQATAEESDFLKRLLVGELRQGALEGVMLDAIAKAAKLPLAQVRRAVMLNGNAAAVARSALTEGGAGLTRYSLQLFRPVQPMLAGSAEDVEEALEEIGEAALEFKFDGARVQVHKDGDHVAIYSRQLNDVTAAIPEIVEAAAQLPFSSAILDGEVLSFDQEARPQAFQVTMRRFGRRLNVDAMRQQLPVSPVWFDLLYADGGELIDLPQHERFAQLRLAAPAPHLAPHLTTSDPEAAREFLEHSIERGHEGVMAKDPAAVYAAGARGQSWLKVKRARTLDLVILAAEWGSGRRRGYLSNLHLGARVGDTGTYAMLGKTFKGLTDQMLAWQTEHLLHLEIARDRWAVYVRPSLVTEIAFNEIQQSSRYESGLALRFARVKRYRTDKSPAEADDFETVKRLAAITAEKS